MSDDRLARIESKVDKLKDDVSDIKTEVASGFGVYNEQLKVHIEGTVQNRTDIKQIQKELQPIKDYINFLKNLVMFVVAATSFIATIYSIMN